VKDLVKLLREFNSLNEASSHVVLKKNSKAKLIKDGEKMGIEFKDKKELEDYLKSAIECLA
jgi:hypothetical protein